MAPPTGRRGRTLTTPTGSKCYPYLLYYIVTTPTIQGGEGVPGLRRSFVIVRNWRKNLKRIG